MNRCGCIIENIGEDNPCGIAYHLCFLVDKSKFEFLMPLAVSDTGRLGSEK
jgi:hypothetical protein